MAITVVLADDHPIVRRGLRALLAAEPDLHVVGEAGDGLEAVQMVERLRPQVLVVDLMMPGLTGIDVAQHVRQRSPHTRVVILSMYDDEPYVRRALHHGVLGYVLKEASDTELVQAIREVVAGERFLSPRLTRRALAAYAAAAAAPPDPYDALTPREREVLHLVAAGMTTRAIAARLCLSPRTIDRHRARLLRALALHTPAELIAYAQRRGIGGAVAAPRRP